MKSFRYFALLLCCISTVCFSMQSSTAPQDCDGGTSACTPCLDQYRDCFFPCNALFDDYIKTNDQTREKAKKVLLCYDHVFMVLGQAGCAYNSQTPLICPAKIRNALANYTRIHHEHNQQNRGK